MKKLFSPIAWCALAGIIFWARPMTSAAQTTNTYDYVFSAGVTVPDDNFSGLALTTNLAGMSGYISRVTVSLDISGGFNGDLYATLAGSGGGFAVLLNRVGVTGGNTFGYTNTGFSVTLDDSASFNDIHFYQNVSYTLNGGGQLTGNWSADGRDADPLADAAALGGSPRGSLLDSLNGALPNGMWTLFLADLSGGEQSTVVAWGLTIVTVPEPSTWALLGAGLMIFLLVKYRGRNSRNLPAK